MGRVLIAGAGPAGAALAVLLAERGTDVVLIERQRDFSREFRGEVLMPSGLQALSEIGVSEEFEAVPRKRPPHIQLQIGRRVVLDTDIDPEGFEGFVPEAVSQTHLLEMLVARAARDPHFTLLRGASVKDLVIERGRVVGLRVRTEEGTTELRGDLIVGADGRASVVRRKAEFEARVHELPMDLVWFKIPCPDWLRGVRAYLGKGHLLISYQTWDDALQVGWVIVKGSYGDLRAAGPAAWIDEMAGFVEPDLIEWMRDHVGSIDRPFLLDTASDCVGKWSVPGALVIGDAAHTMSPVGGQGLNIALRDAIVAANHLVPILSTPTPNPNDVDAATAAIEAERMPEVRTIQRLQALPPKVIMSTSPIGAAARYVVARMLGSGFGRKRGVAGIRIFQFGTTDVHLRV